MAIVDVEHEAPGRQPAVERSKVVVLKTTPENVLNDYRKLMHLAQYQQVISRDIPTVLKLNLSWSTYYPACSSPPWQFEGVVRTMLEDGFTPERILPAENKTVVTDTRKGARSNRWLGILKKYGLRFTYLADPEVEWFRYEPRHEMLVLDQVYPKGILIPRMFPGKNVIHFPTMKTHVFTTTTGAMKNAFGGLLQENRHWTHRVIHETLVDLLTIQKEIHPGIFAVMDGTFCGQGPGPRAMEPCVKNYILASTDQVAIDAVAAKMMGFDPLSIRYIRLAHEKGLGCGDVRELEIVGEDISEVNFNFKRGNTFASRGQKLIYHGPLQPLEKLLLQSPIAGWATLASNLYHDGFWYPAIGRARVEQMMQTEWGRLFQTY